MLAILVLGGVQALVNGAPARIPVAWPARQTELECTVTGQAKATPYVIKATILAEERNATFDTNDRTRTIVISGGPAEMVGKYNFQWNGERESDYHVVINDYAKSQTIELIFKLDSRPGPGGVMVYKYTPKLSSVAGIGFCTHHWL